MTDWLLKEGRYATQIGALIKGLGDALADGGAPLSRLRVSTRILHPPVAAWSAHWRQGGHTEQSEFGFDMFASGQYQGSPGQTIMESGRPLRIHLAEPFARNEHPLLNEMRSVGLVDYYGWPLHGETDAFGNCSFATDEAFHLTCRNWPLASLIPPFATAERPPVANPTLPTGARDQQAEPPTALNRVLTGPRK